MTRSLPEGVVTFLFTDIEGSTRLLTDIGDAAYVDGAAASHRALVEAAADGQGGVVVRLRGRRRVRGVRVGGRRDPRGRRGAAGARRARVGRRRRPGPDGHPHGRGPVVARRLRRHRGPPRGARRGGRRTAARSSSPTRRAPLAGEPGDGHRAARPRRAPAQGPRPRRAAVPGRGRRASRPTFPALKTLDLTPNNLPPQLTTFVGRAEVDSAVALLDRTRLLTLTGPGGTARRACRSRSPATASTAIPDGAWFVPLAPVTDPDLVPSAIAASIGLLAPQRPPLERVKDHLRDRTALLVLDNFEQVVAARRSSPTCSGGARADGDRDQPGAAADLRRAGVPGPAARRCRRRTSPTPSALAGLGGRAAVRRARDGGPARLRADRRERRPRRRDRAPARRAAAGDRARRGADPAALARRDGAAPGRPAGPAVGGRARPARSASGRCAARSTGATTCSTPRSSGCSRGSACSRAAARSRPRSRCAGSPATTRVARRRSAASSGSPSRASCGSATTSTATSRFTMLETIREYALDEARAERGETDAAPRPPRGGVPRVRGGDRTQGRRHDRGGGRARPPARPPRGRARQPPGGARVPDDRGRHRAARADLAFALWRFWHMRGHITEGRARVDRVLAMPQWTERADAGAAARPRGGRRPRLLGRRRRAAAGTHYGAAVEMARALGDDGEIANALYNLFFARRPARATPTSGSS